MTQQVASAATACAGASTNSNCTQQSGGASAGSGGQGETQAASGKYECGDGANGGAVHTVINFGCKGKGNPIMDLTFALLRFLSTGAGIILVGSMVWAGIQYTSSQGDPQASAAAIKRIRANVFALILFIFGYAILNYVIPGAVLG